MIDGARLKNIPKFQQPDCRFTRHCTNVEPVPYSVDAPFNDFVILAGSDVRIVNAQNLCGLGVTARTLVDSDEVEDAVMGVAVHCEANSNRHPDQGAYARMH